MTKTIVLTGGATGIGEATAKRLSKQNCALYILDVAEPKEDTGKYIACDLSDISSIDSAIQQLPDKIDALVNVAGVSNALPGELIMAINFLGLRHLSLALLPRVNAGGTIVNVASTAALDWKKRQPLIQELLKTTSFDEGMLWLREHRQEWQENPYKFSKQCTAAFTYLAVGQAIKRQVRVNCLHPGSTGTQLTSDFKELVGEELYNWGVEQVGREGEPDDIAEVIEFLATGPCRWLNGVEITADGGFVAGMVGGWHDMQSAP